MEEIIFVGGISYSGKSTFCRKIAEKNPDCRYFELDAIFQMLADNRPYFLRLIGRHDPKLYKGITKKFKRAGISDPHDQLTLFANMMFELGKEQEFTDLQNMCELIHLADQLKKINSNESVLIDGSLINAYSRVTVYNQLKKSVGSSADLDRLKKMIIFMDFGLEKSIERYRANPRKPGALKWSEEFITKMYHGQELPKPNEIPNCHVLIAKDEKALDEIIEVTYKGNQQDSLPALANI